MNNDNKKILTMAFLIAGALVTLVIELFIDALASFIPTIARLFGTDTLRHGLPVVLGIITFFWLQLSPRVVKFCDEVVTELKKIVWPSRKDTVAMTMVVCLMLVISGALLGIFDSISGYFINMMTH